ncbi:MAG TPA: type I-E CRISPR-associated protein Cas6/Cse3/CasE, partial [Paracoccaceae bacterium]|nr:type I-E CRISPR-associated protein Cas6/Cse3/CasE [Paracoccaceae bacterium]
MALYLSRLQLARDPSIKAIGALLDPSDLGQRRDAHHRLIWSLFAGDPAASRDFLWRSEGDGRFIILSRRPPVQSPL